MSMTQSHVSTLIGMFASSLTQVTSDANMMKSTDRMRHSLELVYNEQCQDDFLKTDVKAKIDDFCVSTKHDHTLTLFYTPINITKRNT
jgi:hypothetical protein